MQKKRIDVIIAYMETDLRLSVTPNKVASLVNLSPSRLRHLFREETGMSLRQYQKQLRMQKARKLLEDSFLSVKQIMVETGISDRNAFTRSFRETFGNSPTEHRRLVAAQSQTEEKGGSRAECKIAI